MKYHLHSDQDQIRKASDVPCGASPLQSTKPNLFVIGSGKSGTTYLYDLLASHPSIFMCRPKEPTHFVDPKQLRKVWPWGWKQGYWRNQQLYLQLFQSAGTAAILGEASAYYTHLPLVSGVAERIKQFNPDARLIYVMRDPIERTISHYWHRVRYHAEYRSISYAIRTDPQYRDVSHYAMQLTPYFKHFDRDQVKLITFEELTRNTNETIRSIFRWLSIDDSLASAATLPQHRTPELLDRSISGLRQLRQHNSLLCTAIDHTPTSLRRLVARMITREVNRRDTDISDVVRYLRPLQQRQTEVLTKMIGRDFPEWTTLDPRAPHHHERPWIGT